MTREIVTSGTQVQGCWGTRVETPKTGYLVWVYGEAWWYDDADLAQAMDHYLDAISRRGSARDVQIVRAADGGRV